MNEKNDYTFDEVIAHTKKYKALAATNQQLVEALQDIKEWCENAKKIAGVEPYGLAVATRALRLAKGE
jgi:pyridoxine/pyridoxamine 5'-phosphate oxidase